MFNTPTVFTDPSSNLAVLVPAAAVVLLAWWGWEATDGLQSPGNLLKKEIWQATGEGIFCVGPRVVVNSVTDTVVSAATLGFVDGLEVWSVPDEYRDAYQWGYAGARVCWELEAALLTQKVPSAWRKPVIIWDTA